MMKLQEENECLKSVRYRWLNTKSIFDLVSKVNQQDSFETNNNRNEKGNIVKDQKNRKSEKNLNPVTCNVQSLQGSNCF